MKDSQISRRQMLQSSAVAAGIAAAMHAVSTDAVGAEPKVKLKKDDVVLFQGDSITDARRSRKNESSPMSSSGLGDGYPMLIAGELLRDHARLISKSSIAALAATKSPTLRIAGERIAWISSQPCSASSSA